MKILIYNWKDLKNPLMGGAEIITFEYARQLAAEGHQVTWFCRRFSGSKPTETIDGVRIIRRGNALSTYWDGYSYYCSLALKPDLVIDMLNTIAWQTPLYATKQSAVVQYVNQLAKEVWNYNVPWPQAVIGRLLERLQLLGYRHSSVVTYAQSTADDLVAWGYEPKKIFQFRLGIDHNRYRPGQKADYPLLAQVCRLVPNKRADLTIKAFAKILSNHPTAKLAIAGTGPHKDELSRLIKRLGIADRVLLMDKDVWFFKSHKGDQKVGLMQQAWAMIHPSVKEGWGMVITEAAACGTPTIATAVTGQIDAVKHNETGLLVAAHPSVDELARAMDTIITDDALRQRLSQNALEWAAQFDWTKSYQQFKQALEQATGLPLRPPVREHLPALPKRPHIWVVTPVYNAAAVLPDYLAGLAQTNYPKAKITLVMADAGSKDKTHQLIKAAGAVVLDNPRKTGEAGKAVGIKYILSQLKKTQADPRYHLICLLDSDNILTDPDWFDRMVEPYQSHDQIIGSEPWAYYYRPSDGFITRYTALIGMSDPLTMFLGNYDRLNILTGRWTDLPIKTKDKGNYLLWSVDPKTVPTIGANGAMFRANFFKEEEIGDYLFDIDLLYQYTLTRPARFAKVKIGLVHIFCRTVSDFIRKQQRRIQDFHYFHAQGLRLYPWNSINRWGLISFVLACVTILPLLWQMIKGFVRQPDLAWLFHPLACWITLWIYGINSISNRFRPSRLADRSHWSQS